MKANSSHAVEEESNGRRPDDSSRRWLVLAGFVGGTLAVSATGAFVPAAGEWYASLRKPSWTPPGAIFGPVWTLLYLMMATAAWRVWNQRGSRNVRCALRLYGLQLALNAAWTPLFFGLQSPALGLAGIFLLNLALWATLRAFRQHSLLAGLLLVPYALWVAFATILNFRLWQLNRF